jgi:transcription elongation factor
MISKEVVVGTEVCVQDGIYKGLIGQVVEVYDNEAIVFVSMRTIKALKSFPKYVLRLCEGVLGFDSPSDIYPNYDEEEIEDYE